MYIILGDLIANGYHKQTNWNIDTDTAYNEQPRVADYRQSRTFLGIPACCCQLQI